MVAKTLSRLKDHKETVEKLNAGKFTLKGMFKSQTGKATETQNILVLIAQDEKDLANYEIIKNFLTVYLFDIAIPGYKYSKIKNYVKAMTGFSHEEITNAQEQLQCWSEFLNMIKSHNFQL